MGFSLIELSIVLIIIGLLVAGITGGQSLIDSARARAVMNEVENYRRAIDIYFAANGKLPGDELNNGKLGENSGNSYDGTDTKYSDCEDDRSCVVYIDLDKEGILDYSNVSPQYGKMSSILKNVFYRFSYLDDMGDYLDGLNAGNYLDLVAKYNGYIEPKLALNIDTKMDDGVYDNGAIRGECYEYNDFESGFGQFDVNIRVDYDDSIDSKGLCKSMTFKVDI